MSEPWVGALKGQFEAIEARLGTASQPADREALKRDIIALFKRVDTALADLGQMKEDIRGLVERYKQGTAASVATAPPCGWHRAGPMKPPDSSARDWRRSSPSARTKSSTPVTSVPQPQR